MTVELSVIVPALDEARDIRAQLDAVLGQDCPVPFEVVVADGGSGDRTREIVEAVAAGDPRLRLVGVPGSRSSAQAMNAAVAAASGRSLVFTHADDVLAPGCLAALHDALRRHPMAAARLDHHALNPAWTVPFRGIEQTADVPRWPGGPPWPFAYGNALAARREVHEAIGGWDETVGCAADMDFCFRAARDAGADLAFVPEAVVRYRHRRSLAGTLRQATAFAVSEMAVQERHRDTWPEPQESLPASRIVLRNARRLLIPDAARGRLDPVRTRAALGAWVWGLGADIGRYRAGRR